MAPEKWCLSLSKLVHSPKDQVHHVRSMGMALMTCVTYAPQYSSIPPQATLQPLPSMLKL